MKVFGRMTIIALARWSGLKGRSAKNPSTNHLVRPGDAFAEDTPSVWAP
jgi:hypothetical protein